MTSRNILCRSFTALLTLMLLDTAAGAAAPKPAVASILARSPFTLPPFSRLPEAPFGAISPTAYAKVLQIAAGRLERITYTSQGLKVTALVLPPAGPAPGRAPVVIYCRGGVGPAAAISLTTPINLYEMSRYAEAGFFVLAPQYRGADGGEGRDEVGGDDVKDILAAATLLPAFNQADSSQVFLVGASRGAMMALQAVRAGLPARGVVANALPADWELAMHRNERLLQLANEFWPDFKTDRNGALARRSAARWVSEIQVPILLQHGGADAVIHPSVVLEFARALGEAGKAYDLAIYSGDDHPISNHLEERITRAIEWLNEHTPLHMVSVVAQDFRLVMPARLQAGRNRFVFENRGSEPHYFRLMRFADGKGIDDFVAWRATHTPPPDWLIPAGGGGTLAPGERAGYAEDLAAGSYVAFCGHPSPDGVQHVDKGMFTTLTVEGEPASAAPGNADLDIELSDQRIAVSTPFRAGVQTAHFRNTTAHSHQALLVKLPEGVTGEQELAWFRGGSRGPRPGHPMGGVIELGANREAWAGFDLTPGRYLLICAATGADGTRHFDHGMRYAFEVTAATKSGG